MRKIIVAYCFVCVCVTSFSQIENSVFNVIGSGTSTTFVADYQSLGINPANLGWSREFEKKTAALGFAEVGFSLTTNLFNSKLVDKINTFPFSFSMTNIGNYSDYQMFSSDLEEGIALRFDTRIIGFSITTKKVGGFAFSINERYSLNNNFSKNLAEIITFGMGAPYFDKLLVRNIQNGSVSSVQNSPSTFDSIKADRNLVIIEGESSMPKTISQLLNGSELKISWVREYNFGYGLRIFNKASFGLYAGVGVKYIQGLAIYDVSATSSTLTGFSSFSQDNNGISTPNIISNGTYRTSLPESSGSGFGFDFGLNFKAFKFLKVGLSVTDIGSVTWDKNTYQVESNRVLTKLNGVGIYNSNSESGGSDALISVIDSLILFKKGNFIKKVNLPTTMRFGIGFQVGKILQIGLESVTPFNSNPGSVLNSIYSLGGILKLGPFKFSTGFTVYNRELKINRIPVGFTFSPLRGTYEAGISTRDIKSLVKPSETQQPIRSLAVGFLRFRF